MTSSLIQTLLQPPNLIQSQKNATSILNESFSTLELADSGDMVTNSLNSFQSNARELQTQLEKSQRNVDDCIRETRKTAREQLVSAQELSLLRHSLADEVISLTEELDSSSLEETSGPTLLEEIETLHRNLKELQSVKAYVQVIHRALQLSEQAIKHFEKLPTTVVITEASAQNYILLQRLVHSVGETSTEVKRNTDQELKLYSYLSALADNTWLGMKDALSTVLLSVAENLKWPTPVDYFTASKETRKEFESAFANLIRLQEIGEKLHDKMPSSNNHLYPIQALIRPVALRFKYHFEGTRQTNRPDKPEWYFAHILNVSHVHRPFFETVIQRLLQNSRYRSTNAWREFTRLLLSILSRKIKRSMSLLLPHPPLLAHTIYQALAFDEALRESGFSLNDTLEKESTTWEGTSDVILGNKDWFDAWLEGERKFAEDLYNEILLAPDAWQVAVDTEDDAASDREVRPTNSARRVKALIEQITDRYRALPVFLQKTRFLIEVQVPILELYHTRISESLDAFETLSSYLIRAVPGALTGQATHGRDSKNMTSGVEGAQRLVKAYISARWMSSVLATWGEDLFFLELYHEICERSTLKSRLKNVDSLPDPDSLNEEGTIFEELVVQYKKLAERAETMIFKQITGEVEAELKTHLSGQPEVPPNDEEIIAQSLLGPIARLSSHLSFLAKTLPAPSAINFYKRIAEHVASHIVQRQVLYRGRGRMSAQGGRMVLEEANLWLEASRLALIPTGLRRVEGPWERLLEAGRLLSLHGDMFERVVNVLQIGNAEEYDKIAEVVNINELTSEEVIQVLSVREDFMRRE